MGNSKGLLHYNINVSSDLISHELCMFEKNKKYTAFGISQLLACNYNLPMFHWSNLEKKSTSNMDTQHI